MTDEQIRQAFEKWQADHNPTQYPAEREAFSDGWKAALASLERVAEGLFDSDGGCVHLGQSKSSMIRNGISYKSQPLYRIKDKS